MSKKNRTEYELNDEVIIIPDLAVRGSDIKNHIVAVNSDMTFYKSKKAKIISMAFIGTYWLSNNSWAWDDTLLIPYSQSLESWCYKE